MVTITPICSPPSQKGKVSDVSLSFTPLNASYCGEPPAIYIPAKLNAQVVTCLMVDPSHRVNVIKDETLFMNGWHRPAYDECRATLRMHDTFSIPPLGSITLTILSGPKAMSSTFVIIPKSNLFQVKLSIHWLIYMDLVPLLIHKFLKFPHEGSMHVI